MDQDMNNTYMVTVMASAGGEMDTQDVMVMVTNVDEMGDGDPVGGDGCPHDGAAGWRHNHGGCDGPGRQPGRHAADHNGHLFDKRLTWQWSRTRGHGRYDSWMDIQD